MREDGPIVAEALPGDLGTHPTDADVEVVVGATRTGGGGASIQT